MSARTVRQTAFTLVELLMVIAIISVLMGILLTAVHKARKSARVVACMSNIRQIGVAWHSYLSRYDGEFPSQKSGGRHLTWFYGGKDPVITSLSGSNFKRPLNPYIDISGDETRVMEVFRCTEDRDIRNGLTGGPGPTKGYTCYEYFGNCYLMHPGLVQREIKPRVYVPVKISQIDAPNSLVMMLGDVQWYYSVNNAYWDAHFHNRKHKVNLLFLDGHSDYVQIQPGKTTTEDYTFALTLEEMNSDILSQEEQTASAPGR